MFIGATLLLHFLLKMSTIMCEYTAKKAHTFSTCMLMNLLWMLARTIFYLLIYNTIFDLLKKQKRKGFTIF